MQFEVGMHTRNKFTHQNETIIHIYHLIMSYKLHKHWPEYNHDHWLLWYIVVRSRPVSRCILRSDDANWDKMQFLRRECTSYGISKCESYLLTYTYRYSCITHNNRLFLIVTMFVSYKIDEIGIHLKEIHARIQRWQFGTSFTGESYNQDQDQDQDLRSVASVFSDCHFHCWHSF